MIDWLISYFILLAFFLSSCFLSTFLPSFLSSFVAFFLSFFLFYLFIFFIYFNVILWCPQFTLKLHTSTLWHVYYGIMIPKTHANIKNNTGICQENRDFRSIQVKMLFFFTKSYVISSRLRSIAGLRHWKNLLPNCAREKYFIDYIASILIFFLLQNGIAHNSATFDFFESDDMDDILNDVISEE